MRLRKRKETWLTRFQTHISAPIQVVDQPKPIRGLVIPYARSARPVLQISNCLIPFPWAGKVRAFQSISTWEAKEFLLNPHISFPHVQLHGLVGQVIRTGSRASKASAMSILRPFSLPLYVGGNRLMRLKSKLSLVAPMFENVIANELLEFGASLSGTRVNLC